MLVKALYEFHKTDSIIYHNNTVYTINRVTGECIILHVGDEFIDGCPFTQRMYDAWYQECLEKHPNNYGEFFLPITDATVIYH